MAAQKIDRSFRLSSVCCVWLITLGTVSLQQSYAVETDIFAQASGRTYLDPLQVGGFDQGANSGISDYGLININANGPLARVEFAAGANAGSASAAIRSNAQGPYGDAGPGIAGVDANAFVSASFTVDDLIFSGIGPTTIVDPVLEVSGSILANALASSADAYAVAFASVDVFVKLTGPGVNFSASGFQFKQEEDTFGNLQNIQVSNTGVFNGQDLNLPIMFGQVSVPTNTALTMEVKLSVTGAAVLDNTGGTGPYAGSASGDSLFGSTVNFSTTGPAFILEDGATVNSASASLINNVWTGTPLSVSFVPIPGAVFLALGPLLWLLGVTRTRNS